jgi:hypothetical protein
MLRLRWMSIGIIDVCVVNAQCNLDSPVLVVTSRADMTQVQQCLKNLVQSIGHWIGGV